MSNKVDFATTRLVFRLSCLSSASIRCAGFTVGLELACFSPSSLSLLALLAFLMAIVIEIELNLKLLLLY